MKPYAQNVLAQKLDIAVMVAKHLINHISYSLENEESQQRICGVANFISNVQSSTKGRDFGLK